MPEQTQAAVTWALSQSITDSYGMSHAVTKDTLLELVDMVRQYFNNNQIQYPTFSFQDLALYL